MHTTFLCEPSPPSLLQPKLRLKLQSRLCCTLPECRSCSGKCWNKVPWWISRSPKQPLPRTVYLSLCAFPTLPYQERKGNRVALEIWAEYKIVVINENEAPCSTEIEKKKKLKMGLLFVSEEKPVLEQKALQLTMVKYDGTDYGENIQFHGSCCWVCCAESRLVLSPFS